MLVRFVAWLCLVGCLSSKTVKFNTNMTWIKNADEYELERNLRVGDIITASLEDHPSYYITLISQSGEHVLEIRPTTKGTTVFYNCESEGASYKQFDLATSSKDKQQFTVKAQYSGLVISLDEQTVVMDIPGCQLAWHQINKLEMGGNCRSYWGNWKALRVIRNMTEEL